MIATELQLDNLVYYNGPHKELAIVTGVNNPGMSLDYKIQLNGRVDIEYSKIEPVELRHHLLIQFGMKVHHGDYFNDKLLLIERGGHYDVLVYPRGFAPSAAVDINVKINFAHELQNLYQLLAKKKLTYKL